MSGPLEQALKAAGVGTTGPGGIILPPGMRQPPIVGEKEQWQVTPMFKWSKGKTDLMQMIVSQKSGEQRWIKVQEDVNAEFEPVAAETAGEVTQSAVVSETAP